ncbi:hypothetical protein OH146_04810 [Salinibacterium sp. SYSU T00001]|uniref:hypothetical protein n=1 Tax=Homoserinimonas sedimenticola TaxID=2986805 RepID=UPI0022354A8E|nr:hypothetical protein [Salinibacterium sedimenticola]MCW4385093.1 hypothetical protein [Salinibacterium sedimenticola]
MNITVPRYVIIALGAVFSAYQLVLASSSLPIGTRPAQVVLAMVLYAVATAVSLIVSNPRLTPWIASANVVVAILLPVLVASQLPPDHEIGSDYSTWHVAAVGVLMVITSARGFQLLAWIGVGTLVIQSVVWAGPGSLGPLGVIGSVLWVGVSHMLQSSLAKAERDAKAYSVAEREAAEWQTAQEAHLSERRFRFGQTARMALPMLRHIVATRAMLTAGQQRECLYLEAGIRDEIRGRTLLDDAVREQVMAARRRGATVNLLDEGGLDELPASELARIHAEIAAAMRSSRADTIIVRTVGEDSDVAVTVVGLIASGVNLLGHSSADLEEPEIDLWLEIPRHAED